MKNNRILFLLMLLFQLAHSWDYIFVGPGKTRFFMPDLSAEVKLDIYSYAFNNAMLNQYDSTNWTAFNIFHTQDRNRYRRHWDAAGVYRTALSFSGQKHINSTQTFFGYINYNMDYSSEVNQAIVLNPYRLSPFVIADSTAGDFSYYGPTVFASYSHRLSENFCWGASLKYGLYRGLKDIYSMPEINRMSISLSIDVAYQISGSLNLGLSYRPYHINHIVEIVKQPDGKYPAIFRYRGEFEYSKVIGGNDRTENFDGYELNLQAGIHTANVSGVIVAGYFYQWYEVFDGTATHVYDGFYQGQHYYINTAWQYRFGRNNQNIFYADLRYRYISDWAKEPQLGYLIYEAVYHRYFIRTGLRHQLSASPFFASLEVYRYSNLPDRKDYLAAINRAGAIVDNEIRVVITYRKKNDILVDTGLLYHWYDEAPDWNYYRDLQGPGFVLRFKYAIAGKRSVGLKTVIHQLGRNRNNNLNADIRIEVRQEF
jgi:hypothetical protein